MRYSFRLAEVVGHVPDPRRRPGTIKAICDYTGLDRHQVAALLKNEVKYIPLEAISKLCSYLIDRGYAKADELPGRLFGVEPEHFWELLARRRRLQLCLGVRRGEATDTLDDAWVVASDSVLLGELLNGATTLGGTAEHRRTDDGVQALHSPADRPHPEFLRQSLVWSPGQATFAECQQMARSVYESFCETAGDKALVCLGSNKSNPVVEVMVAGAFGCAAFVSQDGVGQPGARHCPLFLRYRDHDPQFPSCFGGVRLAQSCATSTPGIYFEKPDGNWECCGWGPKEDAAFVFYVHRESQGRLEMALGGFSGRATRLLAGLLARRGEDFWPPVYADEGLQVGAFVVRFRLTGSPEKHLEKTADPLPAEADILRLDAEVIARRLQNLDLPLTNHSAAQSAS
jgi:hypothetical protein